MDWTQHRNSVDSLEFMRGVSHVLAKHGPMAQALTELVDSGNYKAVVDFKIDYKEDSDVNELRAARQIQALFSKQEEDWFGYGSNQEQVALSNFYKAEAKCAETNDRLESSRPSGLVSVVSHYATRKIAAILGEVPPLATLNFAFGPGATTNVKSAVANAKAKLAARPVCSTEMLASVGEFLAEFPYLTEQHCTKDSNYFPLYCEDPDETRYLVEVLVGCGKLTFVPKSVKTKRPIVVEPILNGLAQKGIGSYIKDRLKRTCNLDLKDQTRNRESAFKGSVDGSLATIDLANASDTVSIQTVLELLPPDWVDFLGRFRTGTVINGRQTLVLHKWSSMGNAYTFELESLIFYGLAYGCCRALDVQAKDVSTFGDDIIVPSEAAALLVEVLEWYGFEVNSEKSYISGPFRESCGADWFKGSDIRPFYLKERVSDQCLYCFHNWAMRNGERELAELIHAWTFPPNRLYGPDGYGDGHLIGSYSLRSNRESRRSGWAGGFFDTYQLGVKRLKKRYPSDWLLPTYSVYTRSSALDLYDPDVVRGSIGYRRISIYTLATTIFSG
jgi:hypothetical protein